MNNRTQNGVSYVQGFDKENRLISVTTNGQTTQFKYDANGQRTMTLAPNGLYTFYPFPNVEEEVNLNNGDYTLKYTYNTAGAAVGVRTKAKQGATTTNTLHYLYADHLGSTSVVTNSSGGQVQQTRFLPFGGYWGTPTQTVTDRGYTGHLHNDEVGLIYMNARFYVPAVGRFASADTIVPNPTNPQAFNRYSYVSNNPLNRTDPTGHQECADMPWECTDEEWFDDGSRPPIPTTPPAPPLKPNTQIKLVRNTILQRFGVTQELFQIPVHIDLTQDLFDYEIAAYVLMAEQEGFHPAHYKSSEFFLDEYEFFSEYAFIDAIAILQIMLSRQAIDPIRYGDVFQLCATGGCDKQFTYNGPVLNPETTFNDYLLIAYVVVELNLIPDLVQGRYYYGHINTDNNIATWSTQNDRLAVSSISNPNEQFVLTTDYVNNIINGSLPTTRNNVK